MLGLRHPMRREGLHVNVTEPSERLLTPLVQHIGRRLTLKQSSNDTFIIGGGWPAQPLGARRPLQDRLGKHRRKHCGRRPGRARARQGAAAAHLVRGDRLHRRPSHWSASRGAFPGYFTCMATTGFTLGPLMARMLAETIADADRRVAGSRRVCPRPSARLGARAHIEEDPMDRNDVSWQGYWVACPTPYGEDGELRLDLLEALLDHYIEHGIHGASSTARPASGSRKRRLSDGLSPRPRSGASPGGSRS